MPEDSTAFSGFAVDDVDAAKQFHDETLVVRTKVLDEENGLLQLDLAGGDRPALIYRSH